MSLLQVRLHTEEDVKYKDIFIEVKANTDFDTIFNKIEDVIKKDKIAVNRNKIVISDSLHLLDNNSGNNSGNQKFFQFILDNNLECDDIDSMEVICFVSINVPELIYSDILTNCIKKL